MKRAAFLLIMAALVSAGAYAATVTPQRGGGINQFDGGIGSSGGGGVAPEPTGFVLMVDGASRILQTDGTSKVCRAGGC